MSPLPLQFEHPRTSAQRVAQQVDHVQINHDAVVEFAKKVTTFSFQTCFFLSFVLLLPFLYELILFFIRQIEIQMQDTIFNLKDWKSAELHPKVANEQAIKWIFLVDALNFSFWPSPNSEYTVTYKGVPYTGNF